MGTVTVGAPFRGRGFVSRESALRYESDFYNEFFVPPATMISELTGRALERAKVFALVAPAGSPADTDWILDAFVTSLFVDARDPAKMVAEVYITYYLFRSDGGGIPVWTQTYRQRAPLSTPTAPAYAAALNVALGQVFADLSRDLAGASLVPAKR
jgi:cholesterol transport system auxiliary component